MKKSSARLLLLALLAVFAVSCAARIRHYPPDYSNPVYTVAVLPFYNATNDVNGPKMIREEFFKRLQHRNYSVMPLKETEGILLNQMGITLGSQLEMTDAKELGTVLGVDGVVFGYVLNFEDITTGLYNVKRVRAGFKLVDTKTGRVIWSDGQGVKSILAGSDAGAGMTILKEARGNGLDEYKTIQGLDEISGLEDWQIIRAGATKKVEEAAAIALGEKLLTKALGLHLRLESDTMLNMVMNGFPSGPGSPREPGLIK